MASIVFVGHLIGNTRSRQRQIVLIEMGHQVTSLSYVPTKTQEASGQSGAWFNRLLWKLGVPRANNPINIMIKSSVQEKRPDILWIDKGNTVFPWTLRWVKQFHPECRIISWSEDDMSLPHNRSWHYHFGLKYYDYVFTPYERNLEENTYLFQRANKIVHVDKGVHLGIFHPVRTTNEIMHAYGADVGFIGTYESERAESMLYLAQNGVQVRIWGNGWERFNNVHRNLCIEGAPLYEERYIQAICATKINLGFLRKLNRDDMTGRIYEIPACGAFLLAERTEKNLSLFSEDKEVAYFDCNEELLEKVLYYLSHDAERKMIASMGRKRCETSGYGLHDRVQKIISMVI